MLSQIMSETRLFNLIFKTILTRGGGNGFLFSFLFTVDFLDYGFYIMRDDQQKG